MSRKEKLLKRMLSIPSDFTFDELKSVLESLGFSISNKGKTSGSRVAFIKEQMIIRIHKPHPTNIMGKTALKSVVSYLKDNKIL